MSPPGRWSFWLANSSDMSNIAPLIRVERPATNVLLKDQGRNLPGTFSCSLPIESDAALAVQSDSTCIKAERLGVNDEVSRTRWSGFVQSISGDLDAEKVSITAIGWFEEANQRQIRASEVATGSLNFVDQIGGQIASDLMDIANAQKISSGLVVPMHLVFGGFTDTETRTISYQAGQSFGASIDGLSQVEDGFDWIVDPSLRALVIKAWDDYEDRPEVHYRYGVNIASPVISEDGTQTRNRYTVIGDGGITVVVDDPPAIARAQKIIDERVTLSGAGGGDVDVLEAYANTELAFNSSPPITITFKPRSLGNDVPRPGDDFDWGDRGRFTVKRGRYNLDHLPMRFYKGSYSFSAAGDEILDELTVSL